MRTSIRTNGELQALRSRLQRLNAAIRALESLEETYPGRRSTRRRAGLPGSKANGRRRKNNHKAE